MDEEKVIDYSAGRLAKPLRLQPVQERRLFDEDPIKIEGVMSHGPLIFSFSLACGQICSSLHFHSIPLDLVVAEVHPHAVCVSACGLRRLNVPNMKYTTWRKRNAEASK